MMGLLVATGAALRANAARAGIVLRAVEAATAPPLVSLPSVGRSAQLVFHCQSRAATGGLPRVPAAGHQFNAEYKGQVRHGAVCVRAQLACVLQPVLWLNRSRLGVLAPQRLKLTGKKPPFLKLTAGAVTLVRRRQLCTPDVAHLSEAMCFYLATGGCRVRHSRCAELKNGLPCGSATAAENACLQGWSLVNDSGVHMWSQGSFLTTAWRDAARLLPAAAGCWCLAPAQVQAWCNIHA